MPETPEPGEAPFLDLRLPTTPLAPRPAFAGELRRRIEDALAPTIPTDPEEPTMTTTPTPTAAPLAPYLAVSGAAAAIDWYTDVLGAIETTRFVSDDGRVGHAEIIIGGARVMLADEFPEIDVVGPLTLGGTTVALHLEVVEVDHTYQRAVDAGATGVRAPADQGHGNRNATILDPFGHRWMLSQPIDTARAEAAATERGPGGDTTAWEVTGRAPVEPGYLVLHTADRARGEAFYGALFGWQAEGGHVANTRFPLGLADDADPGTPDGPAGNGPRTTVYFRVDEIEPYARQVEALGGRVLVRNDLPSGANAECVDDQGVRFDHWRPAPGY